MNIESFIFGTYPYIVLTIFLLGSWVRFDREQYTWKSDSSQLLSNKCLRRASNLFHVGILAIFFGHLFGLLSPPALFHAIGISDVGHQYVAIILGLIFGTLCLIGAVMLLLRRLLIKRIYVNSRLMDIFILVWLLVTLLLGLSTLPSSWHHATNGDASIMLALSEWVRGALIFQADPGLLADVGTVFKIHLFFGMTVFLLFPFTRLVHIWSFPVGYLSRACLFVRTKRKLERSSTRRLIRSRQNV
ncbi:MAG TPA: respiratory nitrate reductase subunit gamma [Acidiferrobacteraceae bacterium]|nr:respiratory nitrate reductase subunit gamma [Acidiferrobacteraceae bacterium]